MYRRFSLTDSKAGAWLYEDALLANTAQVMQGRAIMKTEPLISVFNPHNNLIIVMPDAHMLHFQGRRTTEED